MLQSFRGRSSLLNVHFLKSTFGNPVKVSQRFLPIRSGVSKQHQAFFSNTGNFLRNAVSDVTADNVQVERPTGPHPHITKFAELSEHTLVANSIVQSITDDMRLETMTPVQSQTINQCLDGADVLAQARTGTGKTIAFLIPTLQRIINDDPKLANRGSRVGTNIRAIIVSPTRELAEQIAVEARKVTNRTAIIVQTAVGGNSKLQGLRKIQREGCHVLVATPGRLKDVLQNGDLSAPQLKALVLDEADRLLDQGFGPEIREIESLLPDKRHVDRQTLMFSATVPREVMAMVDFFMKKGFKFVKTVQEGELQTHERVPQKFVKLSGLENTLPAIAELAARENAKHGSERPFKAIVFFNATAEVALAEETFQILSQEVKSLPRTIEMHARLRQERRTFNAEQFRKAKSAILLSSDVTARGMDFPNVTHVIQAGLPNSEDTYVHRLGRTARGDKQGEGWLLLTKPEVSEARRKLKEMPLQEDKSLETAGVDMTHSTDLPASVASILTQCVKAAQRVQFKFKADAYKSTLGIFNWLSDKQTLVQMMNNRSKFGWALETPPAVAKTLVSKLGLRWITGLNIEDDGTHRDRSDAFMARSSFTTRSSKPRWEDSGRSGRSGSSGRSGFDRNARRPARVFRSGRDTYRDSAGRYNNNI